MLGQLGNLSSRLITECTKRQDNTIRQRQDASRMPINKWTGKGQRSAVNSALYTPVPRYTIQLRLGIAARSSVGCVKPAHMASIFSGHFVAANSALS